MKIRIIISSAFIISTLIALSCASYVKEKSYKNESAKYNFVIASDSTSFKDSIHQKLIEKYKNQANINLLDISKLKNIKTKDYDVILIMDTCLGNTPSESSLSSFIKNTEDKKKIVLFVSAGSYSCRNDNPEIDAITSASMNENIDPAFSEIAKKIDRIISGE